MAFDHGREGDDNIESLEILTYGGQRMDVEPPVTTTSNRIVHGADAVRLPGLKSIADRYGVRYAASSRIPRRAPDSTEPSAAGKWLPHSAVLVGNRTRHRSPGNLPSGRESFRVLLVTDGRHLPRADNVPLVMEHDPRLVSTM